MTAKMAFAALAGAIALGAGAGLAHADPHPPPAPPGNPSGPGMPANPPPGRDYQPLPGRTAVVDNVVPVWAPPSPPPPSWAPWLPVVWNADLPAWGVWWNGGFIQL
ncbi:hypothetical protein ACTXG7_08955 [Mycolicibacterium sp. Dal123E01]|uniref:hypothetical protein n=1 Tax=Mycolicibacterium sp. Dal123E01 TaxID=3457578 RepID=UPI00403E6290